MFKIDNFGSDYSISFKGIERLNIRNSEFLKNELLPVIMVAGNHLTMDFEGVKFIDSSGFQVLVALLRTSELYNSSIDVMNISVELKELFDLLNLSDVFQIIAN